MTHLNDDQIDEILLGDGTSEMLAHVDGCALCAGQLLQFQSAMRAFNQASLAWAEAKSNTISRDLTATPKPSRWTRPAVGAFASAVLALGIGLAIHHPAAPVQAPATGEPTQQIAEDNAMLSEIDSALSVSDVSASDLDAAPARKEKN